MESLMRLALKKADEAEVYAIESTEMLARTTLMKIETCKESTSKGYALRVIKNGAVGFSFISDLSQSARAVKTAMKIARISQKEKYSFPAQHKPSNAKVFQKKIVNMTEDDLIDYVFAIRDDIAEQKVKPIQGEFAKAQSSVQIINSNGLDLTEESTLAVSIAVAKNKDVLTQEYFSLKKYSPQFLEVGKKAGELARKSAGGKPLKFEGPIVLSVDVIQELLDEVVLDAVDGEVVRRQQSKWNDSLSKQVLSENMSLVDDALIPYATGTVSFDDEGVPAQSTEFISKGILKKFLYDTRTGNLVDKKSTGNGFRSSFTDTPGITQTNIVLKPRRRENVMDIDNGVYIHDMMGYHNINGIVGDFALDITQGFIVKNGELGAPIKHCILTGNVFDLFKNVEAFDKKDELRGAFKAPMLRYQGRIISK